MKYIGAHVSSAGGVQNAPLNAKAIGAKAFAMFTKSQRQWAAKPLTMENIDGFKTNLKEVGISPEHVLTHDGYLINLGNPDDTKREKSYASFVEEIKRVEALGLTLLNFHPGSHLREISEGECIELISECMNLAIEETSTGVLVIENTAGQGSNMGYTLEHIADLIDDVKNKKRVGVCIDTCHAFAAGYDLRTKKGVDSFVKQFDKLIGLKYLKGMHLNDSLKDIGSKVDRHESIGKGKLGREAFVQIMNNPAFDNVPLILETPNSDIWESEIRDLYSMSPK
jgi:deoxyribonuclease-4